MKTIKYFVIMFAVCLFLSTESCGPVIISSRPNYSTPSWFYPNRVVNLRYVYFPDYMVYYDLSLGNYTYFNNGIWLTVKVLPQRFNSINFKHAKRVRINNYYGNNILEYRRNSNTNKKGRRSTNNEEPKIIRRRN